MSCSVDESPWDDEFVGGAPHGVDKLQRRCNYICGAPRVVIGEHWGDGCIGGVPRGVDDTPM